MIKKDQFTNGTVDKSSPRLNINAFVQNGMIFFAEVSVVGTEVFSHHRVQKISMNAIVHIFDWFSCG